MKVLVIAQVAHAINAAYCLSLGDASVPSWDDSGEQHHQSLIAGVEMHLANPDATPEQSHESWLTAKLADGWVSGEVKDIEKKVHPCCVPYEQLPTEQKSKDYMFRAVVHALKDLPDADEAIAAALTAELAKKPAVLPAAARTSDSTVLASVAVQYIGRKPAFKDHLFGTGLSFDKDQVRNLPCDMARKFLRHADMFKEVDSAALDQQALGANTELDDTSAVLDEAQKRQEEERKQEEQLLDVKQQINVMTKKSLTEYAMTNYRQQLDKSKSLPEMRQQVIGMIDQYGLV